MGRENEKNKNSQQKISMILIQTVYPNDITLHVEKQRACSAEAENLASVFKKSATEPKPNLNRLSHKCVSRTEKAIKRGHL